MSDAGDEEQDKQTVRRALANDRTLLANERTLAAWWRTAMTAHAAAVAFAKLLGDIHPPWLVPAGATCLVLLAFAVLASAFARYRETARKMESDDVDRIPRWSLWSGTLLLALAGLAALFAVWS